MSRTNFNAKRLRLRKLADGGHEVLDEEGNQLGTITHKDLMDHARQYQEGLEVFPPERLSEGALPVDREVTARVRAAMREDGCSVAAATARVMREDRELRGRYERAHGRPLELCEEPSGPKAMAELVRADLGYRERDAHSRFSGVGDL